jgi:homoserine dehydrogenase
VRALLLGFGNVGRAAADILVRRDQYPGLAGLDVAVVGIVTGGHGALLNRRGIDLRRALAEWTGQGRFSPRHPDHVETSALDATRTVAYDVLVEMTPLTRQARGEPAISHVREALRRGRHAVTANKGPLAWAFSDLAKLAARRRVQLLYEATVMDGVPVFNLARHGLRGATVARVEGILNSTTNAILCALERGGTFADALARAQREGYAEADPSDDLEGWDGAVKLSALANVLMGVALPPEAIAREGIVGLDPARVTSARARGARLKLVCEAWREGRGVRGRVALREIPLADPFALVEDTSSILRLVTDLAGTVEITEQRPDIGVTAYGVISDLLAVSSAMRGDSPRPRPARGGGSRSRPPSRARSATPSSTSASRRARSARGRRSGGGGR